MPVATSLKDLRAAMLARHDLTGPDWCRAWAATADLWLDGLFAAAGGDGTRGVALVAVGGYGRSTLAPGSDLDLLLLHNGRRRRIKELADAIWYPIWDAGQPLDHSVRTVKELRSVMDTDLKVAIGLLDARLIAGDAALAGAARGKALELWAQRTGRWLGELDDAVRARHDRFGDLAFLLEPDLKEARGGLRDIQLLRTLAAVAPPLVGLFDSPLLRWAERMLTAARVELQRPSGSASNVLLLQDQDLVASALNMADADVLMVAVADAARAIAWASDDAWRRVRAASASQPGGRRRRPAPAEELVLERWVALRNGEVCLLPGADPAADPSLALRVAAVSAEQDRPMAQSVLKRLASRALAPEGTWPAATLNSLLRLLGAGRPAIAAIEALDHYGVWLRYLPEWSAVRNRPQRNAYHRYTVDRHLLEAVANASSLQASVSRPDLLLLGTLFHDIGKGREGDHTEIGMQLVGEIGPRLGLAPDDLSVLSKMVELHLLLPDAATRRDLDDPATTTSVAAAVGSRDTLELLAALTRADSLATGPAAWGAWKAGLVDRLVAQVSAALEGRPPPDSRRAELSASELELLGRRELAVIGPESAAGGLEGGGSGAGAGAGGSAGGGSAGSGSGAGAGGLDGPLLVAAPDQTGLLATVAGVLNMSGVNVRSATTMSDEDSGMALLRFEVAPAFDELPDWARVEADLSAALSGNLDVERVLEERDARYRRFQPRVTARLPEARVIFDVDSSPAATIVEVRAADRGPVLYRVTRALAGCGVTITCALVSTIGAEAIDVFYVRDRVGGRVSDPAVLAELEAALLSAL